MPNLPFCLAELTDVGRIAEKECSQIGEGGGAFAQIDGAISIRAAAAAAAAAVDFNETSPLSGPAAAAAARATWSQRRS